MALTRAQCAAQLPAISHPLTVRIHLDITAGTRHASRVADATAALTAAYPTASPDELGAIASMESHGVGGTGGYSGDSTQRMSWARGLGSGRRNASDGPAWTAAIDGIGVPRSAPMYLAAPDLLLAASRLLGSSDLEWPLAYALWCVSVVRFDAPIAIRWSEVATQIASRCEPDSGAGQLAQRYGLSTLDRLWSGEATLSVELVKWLMGIDPIEIPSAETVAGVTVLPIEESANGATCRVRAETRSHEATLEFLRTAWDHRDGELDTLGLVSLHDQMRPDDDEAARAQLRESWESETEPC